MALTIFMSSLGPILQAVCVESIQIQLKPKMINPIGTNPYLLFLDPTLLSLQ